MPKIYFIFSIFFLINIFLNEAIAKSIHGAVVVPVSEGHYVVGDKNIYIEEVLIKKIKEDKDSFFLEIKVLGIHKWSEFFLKATAICKEKKTEEIMLSETNLPTVWSYDKELCKDGVRFCLAQSNQTKVCSRFLDPSTFETIEKPTVEKKMEPLYWKQGEPLIVEATDGRYMRIPWNTFFKKNEMAAATKTHPNWYFAGLLDQVSAQSTAIFLGTGQVIYWPKSSPTGDPRFTPQRIGVQFRYSNSLGNPVLSNGQSITVNWSDLSMNYRFQPTDIFDSNHNYGVMMVSSYSALGSTVNRIGGGFGYSFQLSNLFLNLQSKRSVVSYVDALLLPLDLSKDNRGMIFSSKAGVMWLFESNWFFTSDIEARLLNFSLLSEQSVFRFQLGGGVSF